MKKRSLYKIKSQYKQEAYDLLLEKGEVSASKVRQLFMVKQELTMMRWSRYFNFEELDKYLEEIKEEKDESLIDIPQKYKKQFVEVQKEIRYQIPLSLKLEAYDILINKGEISADLARKIILDKQELTISRWSKYFTPEERDKYLIEVVEEIE